MTAILIAEDEARIAAFVAKGLRAAGFTATVVSTGADALGHARTGEFDLLVLDIGLPAWTVTPSCRSCAPTAAASR